MKHRLLILSFALWTFPVWGQELDFFGQLGGEVRAQSTANPEIKVPASGLSLGLFILRDQFGLLEEIAFFRDSSSSGNLEIKYHTIEWNQWLHYIIRQDQTFKPYFGVGLGLSQDKVETTLSATKRTDKSRIFVNAGAAAGLLARLGTRFDGVVEARAWKFEQKKDPVFSGLLSLRFKF